MSSCGLIYYEEMSDATSARHDLYYVTNTIAFEPSSASSSSSSALFTNVSSSSSTPPPPPSNVCEMGAGVSVYYSSKLGLLFWSYESARSFVAPFAFATSTLPAAATPTKQSTTTSAAETTTPPLRIEHAVEIRLPQQQQQPLWQWDMVFTRHSFPRLHKLQRQLQMSSETNSTI